MSKDIRVLLDKFYQAQKDLEMAMMGLANYTGEPVEYAIGVVPGGEGQA
jgi:hypothetical protein